MSYTMVCRTCPDHSFLDEDRTGGLTHAGIGYESDGSQVADGRRRDADHRPDPMDINSIEAQEVMLERIKVHVRREYPQARHLILETTDQSNGYGFRIDRVTDADPVELADDDACWKLCNDISGELADLNWSERGGIVGEGDNGWATILL